MDRDLRRNHWGGLDEAVEALVLYDNVFIDGESFYRCVDATPQLLMLEELCTPLPVTEEATQRTYQRINAVCQRHLAAQDELPTSLRGHVQDWLGDECGVETYPSASWDDAQNSLPDAARALMQLVRAQLPEVPGAHVSGLACLTLLRALYYDQLQQDTELDLIVHPLKAGVVQPSERLPHTILSLFDRTVREQYEARKQRWFGQTCRHLRLPLLTSYVLTCSHLWSDIPDVIAELRTSREATQFRTGITQLRNAIETSDNLAIDETIGALDAAAEAWSRNLNASPPSRAINLQAPVLGQGTAGHDVDPTIGPKLLVFVHTLLARA